MHDNHQSEKLLNMTHARTPAQQDKMQELIKLGICPFCSEYLEQYHDNPIEQRGTWWNVTKNDYPYEGATLHYLFIYRSHMSDLSDVPAEAYAELGEFARSIAEKNNIKGATLLMRFGDTEWTGGTVTHLHAQLVVGGPFEADCEKIKVGIGYKKR